MTSVNDMSSVVMSNLFAMPLWLGLAAFLIGWATSKFAAHMGTRSAKVDTPEHHQEIRDLEATLRITKKDFQEASQKLETVAQEAETLRNEVSEYEQTLQSRDEKIAKMKKAVLTESEKVAELRQELSGRAEQTLRAEARARDIETKMSVMQAGSEAFGSVSDDDAGDEMGGGLDDWLQSLDDKSEEPEKASAEQSVSISNNLVSDC